MTKQVTPEQEKILRDALASLSGPKKRKHGLSNTREYRAWGAMKNRCTARGTFATKHYGDRGIKVCERWANDFLLFYFDMGPCPSPKHEIDRIDVNGDYEPSNCRWVTGSEQAKNKRPVSFARVKVNIFGREQMLSDVCRELELPYAVVSQRIRMGWSIERALNEPIKVKEEKTHSVGVIDLDSALIHRNRFSRKSRRAEGA